MHKVSILHFSVAGFVWKPFYRRTCSNTLFGFQVCGHNICTGHNGVIAYLNLVLDREDEGTQLRILSFAKISSFWPPDISAKSLILKFIKDNASWQKLLEKQKISVNRGSVIYCLGWYCSSWENGSPPPVDTFHPPHLHKCKCPMFSYRGNQTLLLFYNVGNIRRTIPPSIDFHKSQTLVM